MDINQYFNRTKEKINSMSDEEFLSVIKQAGVSYDCFKVGNIVKIIHPEFEFKQFNKRTGHYARGKIIKLYDNGKVLVELFNKDLRHGFRHRIEKKHLIKEEIK